MGIQEPFSFVPCAGPGPSPAQELQQGYGSQGAGMLQGLAARDRGPQLGGDVGLVRACRDPADGTASSHRRAGDTAAAHGDIPQGTRAQAGGLALGQRAETTGGVLPPSLTQGIIS